MIASVLQLLPAFANDDADPTMDSLPIPPPPDATDDSIEVRAIFLTVNFELHGGVATSDFEPQRVQFATVATRPATNPIREGYIFTGWFTSATGGFEFNFTLPILFHLTLHARWEQIPEISHVVTFNFNGGIGERGLDTFIQGALVPVRHAGFIQEPYHELGVNVSRASYELVGWTTVVNSHSDIFDFNTPITQNLTLYGLWAPEPALGPGPIPPPNSIPPLHPSPPPSNQGTSLIAIGPPSSSGITMDVNDSGAIVITGSQTGEGEITISNAPPGVEFLRVGVFSEIFILFPNGTEAETIDVTTPTDEWTYEFFDDVRDNLVLALLPPGVDLATVLRDPLNPQPRDQSLLNLPVPEQPGPNPRRTRAETPSTAPASQTEVEFTVNTSSELPETGAMSYSLSLLGLTLLTGGCLLSSLKLKIDRIGR